MVMYWPEARVALDIIDDPLAEHVDGSLPNDWRVLRVTSAQLNDLEETRRIGDTLCELLGQKPPEKNTGMACCQRKALLRTSRRLASMSAHLGTVPKCACTTGDSPQVCTVQEWFDCAFA